MLVILYSINIECRPVIDRTLMGGTLEVEKESPPVKRTKAELFAAVFAYTLMVGIFVIIGDAIDIGVGMRLLVSGGSVYILGHVMDNKAVKSATYTVIGIAAALIALSWAIDAVITTIQVVIAVALMCLLYIGYKNSRKSGTS